MKSINYFIFSIQSIKMRNIVALLTFYIVSMMQISAQGVLNVEPNMFFEEYIDVDLSPNFTSLGLQAAMSNSGDSSLFIKWKVVMDPACPFQWGVGISPALLVILIGHPLAVLIVCIVNVTGTTPCRIIIALGRRPLTIYAVHLALLALGRAASSSYTSNEPLMPKWK